MKAIGNIVTDPTLKERRIINAPVIHANGTAYAATYRDFGREMDVMIFEVWPGGRYGHTMVKQVSSMVLPDPIVTFLLEQRS